MNFIEEKLCERVAESPALKWILLDFWRNSIDAVAIHALEDMMDNCSKGQIKVYFAGIKGPVRDLLKKAGWNEKYADRMQYVSIAHVLSSIGK